MKKSKVLARVGKSEKSKLLPPKLMDWTEGHVQMGIFVRTEMGSVIEYVNDNLDTPGARKEIRDVLSPFLGEEARQEVPRIWIDEDDDEGPAHKWHVVVGKKVVAKYSSRDGAEYAAETIRRVFPLWPSLVAQIQLAGALSILSDVDDTQACIESARKRLIARDLQRKKSKSKTKRPVAPKAR